jgi:hypothetical protein
MRTQNIREPHKTVLATYSTRTSLLGAFGGTFRPRSAEPG